MKKITIIMNVPNLTDQYLKFFSETKLTNFDYIIGYIDKDNQTAFSSFDKDSITFIQIKKDCYLEFYKTALKLTKTKYILFKNPSDVVEDVDVDNDVNDNLLFFRKKTFDRNHLYYRYNVCDEISFWEKSVFSAEVISKFSILRDIPVLIKKDFLLRVDTVPVCAYDFGFLYNLIRKAQKIQFINSVLTTCPNHEFSYTFEELSAIYSELEKNALQTKNILSVSDILNMKLLDFFLLKERQNEIGRLSIQNYIQNDLFIKKWASLLESYEKDKLMLFQETTPTFSFVIPVYNTQKYILDLVNSLKKQKYINFEAIFIDDGSTDDSLNILQDVVKQDKRFTLICQSHKGPATARNLGIENAQGHWITFVDSDDMITDDYFDRLLPEVFTKQTDLTLYGWTTYDANISGEGVSHFRSYFPSGLLSKELKERLIFSSDVIRVVKRKLLIDNKIFFQNISSCNDVSFALLSYFFAERISVFNEVCYLYRRNRQDNISSTREKYLQNIKLAFDEIEEKLFGRFDFSALCKDKLASSCHALSTFFSFSNVPQSDYHYIYNWTREEIKNLSQSEKSKIKNLTLFKDLDFIEKNSYIRMIFSKNFLSPLPTIKSKLAALFFSLFYFSQPKIEKLPILKKESSQKDVLKYLKTLKKQLKITKRFRLWCLHGNYYLKFADNQWLHWLLCKYLSLKQYYKLCNQIIKLTNFKKITPLYPSVIQYTSPISLMRTGLLHKLPNDENNRQKRIWIFSIHLVEHCNLNCKYCAHFSPLAMPEYVTLEDFTKNIKRMSTLFNKEIQQVALMGGEPLLHPDLIEILKITRQYLPYTNILVITNGILLTKQPQEFWDACREYDIAVEVTKYPLSLDFDKMRLLADKNNVSFGFYNKGQVEKVMRKTPLDLAGKHNPAEEFKKCFLANSCCFLWGEKLFTCTIAPNIRHFNKFFNKNVELSDKDYIDIFKVKNAKEALEFLSKPIPFCKYCNVDGRIDGLKWHASQKDINEWI